MAGGGLRDAALMCVGGQPGEQEDRRGRPFVGPAGAVFTTALDRVDIDRAGVFVATAVKPFTFAQRGGRRIHQKPEVGAIDHCRWWLDLERRLVQPRPIVATGATAARGVFRRRLAIARNRAAVRRLDDGGHGLVTVHPSPRGRRDEDAQTRRAWNALLTDLAVARDRVGAARPAGDVDCGGVPRRCDRRTIG